MFIKVTNINPNIRKSDFINVFTLDKPIYRIKELKEGVLLMYETLSQLQLCLEFDGIQLIDPLNIEYIEVLVPVQLNKTSNKGQCVCFVSNILLQIEEIEQISLPVLLFVSKNICGKYFYVVEFEKDFDFSKTLGFYDIFTFRDYLDYLIYSGKI